MCQEECEKICVTDIYRKKGTHYTNDVINFPGNYSHKTILGDYNIYMTTSWYDSSYMYELINDLGWSLINNGPTFTA